MFTDWLDWFRWSSTPEVHHEKRIIFYYRLICSLIISVILKLQKQKIFIFKMMSYKVLLYLSNSPKLEKKRFKVLRFLQSADDWFVHVCACLTQSNDVWMQPRRCLIHQEGYPAVSGWPPPNLASLADHLSPDAHRKYSLSKVAWKIYCVS